MTDMQKKIISLYEGMKVKKVVYPSIRQIAEKANCSVGMVHETIKNYVKKQK